MKILPFTDKLFLSISIFLVTSNGLLARLASVLGYFPFLEAFPNLLEPSFS